MSTKHYPETHQFGSISIENVHLIRKRAHMSTTGEFDHMSIDGDLGIQIGNDGRVWVCIDGIAFLRFRPQ